MHRIPLLAGYHPPEPRGDWKRGTGHDKPHGDFTYCLFTPVHYEPGYAYPLVVWLHPNGSHQEQLLDVMPRLSLRNYLAIAPRGLHLEENSPGWPSRGLWSEVERRVLASIEIASRDYHVAPDRVFLAGVREGGSAALQLGLDHPQRFAGVVSLGGGVPFGATRFTNLYAARSLPLLITHGRRAGHYGEGKACQDLRILHAAGMALAVRQYPDENQLDDQLLGDVNRWIMERVTDPSMDRRQSPSAGDIAC
jgi:phospholipase/carboxylesterase